VSKGIETSLELRRFVVASLIVRAYEKVKEETKGAVMGLFAAQPALYHSLDVDDAASAPIVLKAGDAFKVILSGKSFRSFKRPCEAPEAKLTAKQMAAITSFDAKLVDAALTSGLISADQAAVIALPVGRTEFPMVQVLK
jgi:hypothetical protein